MPCDMAHEGSADGAYDMIGYLALAAYIATIPVANWMMVNIGQCIPNGPCLVPVGFGLIAPSGVLMVGFALVLRDLVHSKLGWRTAIFAIFIGAAISFLLSSPALVVASVAAFLLSELADFAVYAPLRKKRLITAVIASGVIGAAVDSAVFLWIAFGSLDYISGQILGKIWVTVIAAFAILSMRKYHAIIGRG